MKIKKLLLMTVIAALALSACGGETSATQPSAEKILSSVNTVVALTNMAQPKIADSNVSAPATLASTSTPATFATATLIQPINTPIFSSYAASASACDSSHYISDVTISDGTVIAPGEAFTKTWTIQNTGTCTWNSNYTITFSSGDNMSGEATTIDQSVSPNETGNVSLELTAPETDGTYTGYWILSNSNGTAFGNYVYVQIVVSADASTSTPLQQQQRQRSQPAQSHLQLSRQPQLSRQSRPQLSQHQHLNHRKIYTISSHTNPLTLWHNAIRKFTTDLTGFIVARAYRNSVNQNPFG